MAQYNFNPLATVNPSAAPTAGFSQRAGADAFGGQIAQAAEGLAAADADQARVLGQAGDVANKHAMAFAELNAETAAKQGDVQYQAKLRTQGFGDGTQDNPGYFTTQGQNAFDGAKPAMENAQKALDEVMNGLPNDAAKRMFRDTGNARLNSFSESVAQHGAQGRKEWMIGTSVARQASAKDNAVDYYDDPVKVATNIAVAKSESLAQGELHGWSPEQVIVEQKKQASDIRVAVIDRKLTADPMGAQADYQAHMDDVDPSARAQVEKALKAAVQPVQSNNFVQRLMNGGSVANPQAGDAVVKGGLPFDAIAMAESGGKNYNADGSVVTSPKGAQGKMQVMPATGKSPGFGVRPSDGSVADNERMGRDYYGAMVARYGDQSLALAAYNAGPGAVDSRLAKIGAKPGEQVDVARVVSMMPAETRGYVEKINAASPPQAGHIPTSDDVRDNLGAWTKGAMTWAEQAYPNDPSAQKMVMADLEQRSAQIVRGQNYADKAGQNMLLGKVYGIGTMPDGSPVQLPLSERPQNLQDLLKDPAAAKVWSQMDSIQQTAVLSRLGKDDNPTTTASEVMYHQLDGLSHTDPAGFGNINFADPKYVDAMPKARIASLMGMQQKMLTTQGHDAIKAQNWNWAMGIAKTAPGFKEAGIPLSITKTSTKAQADTYNQFGSRISEQVQQYQADHKKLPTPDEVRGMAGQLLISGTVPATGWLSFLPGLHTTTQRAYQADPAKFDVPLPPGYREGIIKNYKSVNNGATPSDDTINDLWRTHRLRAAAQ
jgi:hypothetical protein